MKKKYYLIIGIVIIVLLVWNILSPKNIFNSSCPSCYKRSILYCEIDEDCDVWWGPDYCGCGNIYYVFSEGGPSLVCGGPANYTCRCIENKCE